MTPPNNYKLGQFINYQSHYGFITFISNEYLTLCINESPKPEPIARGAKFPFNQVNLLIYPSQYSLIESTTTIHQRYI